MVNEWKARIGQKTSLVESSTRTGQEFDDLDKIANSLGKSKWEILNSDTIRDIRVEQIRISYGGFIDAIQFSYKIEANGRTYSIIGDRHGGGGPHEAVINFEPGEYISKVSGARWNNETISQLGLQTYIPSKNQTKNYGPWGTSGNTTPFSLQSCACFFGKFGTVIANANRQPYFIVHAIGAYESKIVDEEQERREREERRQREERERREREERERIQRLLQQQRQNAIQAVKDHWNSQATNSKVNGKDQNTVLGSNWESGINSKATESAINAERDRLKGLIDSAKKAEQTQQQQLQAITAIENHWKQNQDSEGKINGQTINQLLGSNWKDSINSLSTSEGIKNEQNKLTGMINQAKEEEKKKICNISEHQNYQQIKDDNEKLKNQITQLQAKIKELYQVIGIEESEAELSTEIQTLTVQEVNPPKGN